jgi:sulfite reductase beta subunit-like hemoprotein
MTTTAGPEKAPENAPPENANQKRHRSEGQWALGYREPLNGNEQQKKDDDALHVRERILSIYSRRGFESIDPADLRGRFRWMGLYTQRRPGIDGGRTGSLEPEEIEDSYFMMRIRLDGGALTSEQLRTIGEVSQTFARDSADISDRSNIQLHWVRIEDVPEIWERLESVGLHTMEACGDCPRAIIGSPVAGVDAEEIVDATPAVREIRERYIGDPAFANLPRKYKTSISGSPDWDAERVGSYRLRTTVHQNLIVLDVPEADVDGLRDELDGLGLATDPSPWRRAMLACTGIEFCKLAIVETKAKGAKLVEELEARLADVNGAIDTPISVTINGCPNACARTQVADIGLKGQIITTDAGEQVPGYQVHLGGGLAADSGLGRKVRGLKITENEVGEFVERLARRYLEARAEGERFAGWAARAEEGELA